MKPNTEAALAAIFRHCDEVADGKRPSRTEKEGKNAVRAWLGVKHNDLAMASADDKTPTKEKSQ